MRLLLEAAIKGVSLYAKCIGSDIYQMVRSGSHPNGHWVRHRKMGLNAMDKERKGDCCRTCSRVEKLW